MDWLTSPFGVRLQRVVNGWIERNSADPTGPILTGTVAARPSVQAIMARYDDIRLEVLMALPSATTIEGDLFFDHTITNDGKWDKVYIKWYSGLPDSSREQFPNLSEILDTHPDVHLAMVSVLKPGAVINPHCGPWMGSVRVHIGIQTPNSPQCRMTVGDSSFYWQDRKVEAFDDTYIHMVRNNTDEARVILFLDVERKMKSWWAQAIVRLINLTLARSTGWGRL